MGPGWDQKDPLYCNAWMSLHHRRYVYSKEAKYYERLAYAWILLHHVGYVYSREPL